MRLFFVFCIFLNSICLAQDIQPKIALYNQKIKQFLLLNPRDTVSVQVNEKGLFFKKKLLMDWDSLQKIENQYLNKIKQQQARLLLQQFSIIPAKPLLGWRIALDPGHFAGDLQTAKIEGKYLEMMLSDSTKIEFWESHLAWATAKLLQERLENAGATVMITRSRPEYTAFESTFKTKYQEYLQRHYGSESLIRQSIKSKKTRMPLPQNTFFQVFFKRDELRKRVEKINAFKPDLTLIMHYNVDEKNTGWDKTVSKNFSMAFVGGAFELEDLKEESLDDFVRLMCTQDTEKSVLLAQKVLHFHQKDAKVPIVPLKNDQDYLQEKCLYTGVQGVYARNLLLARAIEGVVCYGESLLQDSEQEIRRLNEKTLKVDDIYTSPRISEIADAYFKGIMSYCQNHP
ncbi:MAG: N-acetylmuramoyl-L-alanine amidase [Raineya sp.]|jgi:N-acetylmuramoyl-L-alanine amidase|nr:N-acetylmuramoyl-L-alanine amidase [Raineya sp.]